jgi:outer membrane protein assembly factor BamD (BamD/ComL family)
MGLMTKIMSAGVVQKMTSKMLILMLLWVLLPGCAAVGTVVTSPAEQERNLAVALDSLRSGNNQQARDLLEKVCEAQPWSGVTDEALFRLALFYLGDDGAKAVARSQQLLDRLKNEFPQSSWTHQSAPLSAYLAGVKALRDRQRELKTLQELNLSLSRDNRELRQSLERLKQLDMELEQKIKR